MYRYNNSEMREHSDAQDFGGAGAPCFGVWLEG